MVKNDLILHSSGGSLVLSVAESRWCTVSLVTSAGESVPLGSDSPATVRDRLLRALDGGMTSPGGGSSGFLFFIALFEDHWSGHVRSEREGLSLEFRSDGARRKVPLRLTEAERSEWVARLRCFKGEG